MSWTRVIGQRRVKSLLTRSLETERIAHAYLFFGREGFGTDAIALEFAKTLNCTAGKLEACDQCSSCKRADTFRHPNIKFVVALPVGKGEKQGDDPVAILTDDQIEAVREELRLKALDPYYRVEIPKGTFIKINSIRDIKRESSFTQFEGGRKVFIISGADQMNPEASNSLLKTLEEPLADTVLLLTTTDKERLLPTIISRCQLVQCDPLSDDELASALVEREGTDPAQARVVSRLAEGSFSAARDLLSKDMVQDRAVVVDYLRMVVGGQRVRLSMLIDELIAEHDKFGIERWLKLLHAWLREALIRREGDIRLSEDSEQISIDNFVRKFPRADLFGAQTAVEAAIAHLRKNVYLPLLLTAMSVELRHRIAEPEPHDTPL